VILAKTIKGYGLGKQGQAKNPTHQLKKVDIATIREVRDRFNVPIPDDKLEELPFYKPKDDDPIMVYLQERRKALGGYLPQRRRKVDAAPVVPPLSAFDALLKGSEGREISTTMAFVRILTALVRDKDLGKHIVPIVPDEARTFGMEGMFRQLAIYSSVGQKYEPVDRDQVMYYREDKGGTDSRRGHQRSGRILVLDRGGDFVQPFESGDGAVLHLLFDVRLPTRRRSRVGSGRPARAGFLLGATPAAPL